MTTMLGSVWDATWARLSPVTSARARSLAAMTEAIRSIILR